MVPKSAAIVIAVGLPAILLGSRPVLGDPIYHGPMREPGNSLPEGARSICPQPPPDAPFISHLKSGWALSVQSTANVKLLFSNQVLACEDLDGKGVSSQSGETCTNAWAFSLNLPAEFLRPGMYPLVSWANGFAEWSATAVLSNGCNGGSCTSSTSAGAGAPALQGTLEIFGVNDQCVTGRIVGLLSSQREPPLDYEGAFYAVRCTEKAP